MKTITINKKQEGSILLVSLVLIVLMTMIGLSASANVVFQTKIVSNELDRDMAFTAAETGLKLAESTLHTLTGPTTCPKLSELSGGFDQYPCDESSKHDTIMQPLTDENSDNVSWWNGKLDEVVQKEGKNVDINNIEATYTIELVKRVPQSLTIGSSAAQFYDEHYRITSRGVGKTQGNAVVLQSVYYIKN